MKGFYKIMLPGFMTQLGQAPSPSSLSKPDGHHLPSDSGAWRSSRMQVSLFFFWEFLILFSKI
ncbi:hypothetical protein ACS0TY_013307 [Phlomoides rotata]